jgi:hypothetical protein
MAETAHLLVYLARGGDGSDRLHDLGNDPDFRQPPITWGICRTNIRRNRSVGDHLFFVASLGPKVVVEERYFLAAYVHVGEVLEQSRASYRFDGRENVIVQQLPSVPNSADAVMSYVAQHRDRLAWADQKQILADLDRNEAIVRERAQDFCVVLDGQLFVHSWWDSHEDWKHRLEAPYVVGGPESRVLVSPLPYVEVHEQSPSLPMPEKLRTKVGFMYWHIPKRLSDDDLNYLRGLSRSPSREQTT